MVNGNRRLIPPRAPPTAGPAMKPRLNIAPTSPYARARSPGGVTSAM
jgi:hypothetical protein